MTRSIVLLVLSNKKPICIEYKSIQSHGYNLIVVGVWLIITSKNINSEHTNDINRPNTLKKQLPDLPI